MKQILALQQRVKKTSIKSTGKVIFWFLLGGFLGFCFFVSAVYIYYKEFYGSRIYPGIFVNGINFGGKTKEEVMTYFQNKNSRLNSTMITLRTDEQVATVSAEEVNAGYDGELLGEQAYTLGKSDN